MNLLPARAAFLISFFFSEITARSEVEKSDFLHGSHIYHS
jgi:hypothetical protein